METGAKSDSSMNGGVLSQLDSFVVAAKQLETALHHERESARRLRQELHEQQTRAERDHRETESKLRELANHDSKLRAAIATYQDNERKLLARGNALTSELKKVRNELAQYRAAWADVLQREREAKLILQESEENRRKTTELEVTLKNLHAALEDEKSKRQQAERHSNSYQLELKNALIRIHSSEVKFNELNKELTAFRRSKRNLDEEVAKIEADLRERLTLESLKDREKTKAELERETAIDRERYREQAREQIRIELARTHELEREQYERMRDGLESEICSLRLSLEQAREIAETIRVEGSNRLRAAEAAARETLEATRQDLEQRLVRAQESAKNEQESIRRELNTKLLELQVRSGELEAELRAAQSQVNALRKDEAAAQALAGKVEALELENVSLKREAAEAASQRARANLLQNEKNALIEKNQNLEIALLGTRENFEQGLETLASETRQLLRELPFRAEIAAIEDRIQILSKRLNSQLDTLRPGDRARLLGRMAELFDEKDGLLARQAETRVRLESQLNQFTHAAHRAASPAQKAMDQVQ